MYNRKHYPIATGVLDYFPDAIKEVALVSYTGNEQHHPGQPLHWDRSKSTDEADALVRHLMAAGTLDTDGISHTAKVAWRALALLQKEIEAARDARAPNTHEPHWSVEPLTYDERRTSHLKPCECGRLFTRPERCLTQGRCLALDHPHAK